MIKIEEDSSSPAIIKVIGVGGGGMNAVSRMLSSNLKGVHFLVTNTDEQVLIRSDIENKIQLGSKITRGMGAGGDPEIGARAAEEDKEKLSAVIKGADMVFVTAGMGGGTGTGAAPIIARIAREQKCLVVGVVTTPFTFEGKQRSNIAQAGIKELRKNVDTLITINNDSINKVIDKKTSVPQAFEVVDSILLNAVRGISDIINIPGYINVDFADVKSVMENSGDAIMGVGEGVGEEKVNMAVEQSIDNLLLEDTSIVGASSILINVTGDSDLTFQEFQDAATKITAEVSPNAKTFIGMCPLNDLKDKIRITVIATGFHKEKHQANLFKSENIEKIKQENQSSQSTVVYKEDSGIIENESKEKIPNYEKEMDYHLPPHLTKKIKDSQKPSKRNEVQDYDIPTYLRRNNKT